MRLNKFIAASTVLSRRAADAAINDGRVTVNSLPPKQGVDIADTDEVRLDGELISPRQGHTTIMLNKPVGYVCSRDGQGSHTIFELLPAEYQRLQPIGRLDKDSSGLLLLTDDGEFANQLTHPRYEKAKIYEVTLDKPLEPLHQQMISDHGINLEDGLSRFSISKIDSHALDAGGEQGAGGIRRRASTSLETKKDYNHHARRPQPPNPPHTLRSRLQRQNPPPHSIRQL